MESTRETIRLTNSAAKLGTHAALVLTPGFYGDKMDDRALIHHFSALADQADISIILYTVPKYAHVTISVNAVRVLSQHPNILGMKDSSGDVQRLATIKNIVKSDFTLFIGTASAWFPGMVLGLDSGIMALANCAPNECIEILTRYLNGKLH